jgi:hypothetical protein
MTLQDQFEWDVRDRQNSPELFAQRLCTDLGLSREFEVSIAHSIREQINKHLRALAEGNEDECQQKIRPVVRTAVRKKDELELWTPVVSGTMPQPSIPSTTSDLGIVSLAPTWTASLFTGGNSLSAPSSSVPIMPFGT